MKRFYLLLVLCTAISLCASAQIGYQVSLLNNATGEPRANERVTVKVKITDSTGKKVCEETKNETSNDFGVISMSVGNSKTFANADWSKLPFFIEASVDGRVLGKSQLLAVPVAEHAKHTGDITVNLLCSKIWQMQGKDSDYEYRTRTFERNGSVVELYKYQDEPEKRKEGQYTIDGNMVYLMFLTIMILKFCIIQLNGNAYLQALDLSTNKNQI